MYVELCSGNRNGICRFRNIEEESIILNRSFEIQVTS
jgi:hypothetical protein